MKLSVLIVNWNTRDLVLRCVESVLENEPKFPYEIIVVDNGSTDSSPAMLENRFGSKSNVKIIESNENLGFAKANNLAFKNSSGEYVLMLNSDAEATPGALDKLVEFLERNREVGVIGPKILNPDGTLQHSVRRFPDVWSGILMLTGFVKLIRPKRYLMSDFLHDRTAEVDQVMGAALLTRKDLIEKVGFLDEHFWLWFEEVDFCKRVKTSGFKIMFYPEAVIVHHGGESFLQFDVFERKKTLAKSLVWYFEKNGKGWQVFLINLVGVIFVAAAEVADSVKRALSFLRSKMHV